MRNYKLTLSYDGTRYQGFQRQQNTRLTIQQIVEEAVSEVCGYAVKIYGAGRTDAGVHALGQVAHVQLSGKVDELELSDALNAKLPEDIRIRAARLVPGNFHSRYSAVGKCYEYQVDLRERPNVFERRYRYHYPNELDLEQMRIAAAGLVGLHDFAGFCDRTDKKSTRREISRIDIVRDGELLRCIFEGSGFLYHMVRILTGTLLEVGRGEKMPEEIRTIIKSGKRAQAGFLAPAHGLFLKEVYYKEEIN